MVDYTRKMELAIKLFHERMGFDSRPEDWPVSWKAALNNAEDYLEEEANDHDYESAEEDW